MDLDDVTLLAQQIRETNKLSTKDATYLRSLCIQLKNPVLPQHEIETRAGSRPPTHEEIKKFEEIESIKKGCYNASEDKIIIHNWKEFCKLNHWNIKEVEPFLLLREENKTYIRSKNERKRFVQFLADGLPNRTLYSVYHRFRTLYADNFQRRFHPDEDRMILDHLEHNINLNQRRKYTDLARVLKRTRISIWRRYKLLKKKRYGRENY
ncbi:uncharacterized protein LOC126865077 isoform X1 [Bombus huntii]|uniref:uncharacterized protein LOC126865077 isoform X1 n=1 Tax=Bombus huntii TaxID=85661 RepID=UPI0021A9A53C|nr:uncharacterized protein LOC126865077 isoform X1 [Bombus huntii]XP_050473129.1 uncharacterized protein LOC126865077 isoform X1 [Bombus huntii]XP_050473130.1 uncharacterized protein LOC126865077 isoform X1 [Bombus huntii]XP_050473131.1 uncharacterized protein LOC126865077 isoform X1 [Bombus huntii]